MINYYYPTHLLEATAKDIAADLKEEAVAVADIDPEDEHEQQPEITRPLAVGELSSSTSVPTNPTGQPQATTERDPQPKTQAVDVRDQQLVATEERPAQQPKSKRATVRCRLDDGETDERQPSRKRLRDTNVGDGGDSVAGRTRSRICAAPYTAIGREDDGREGVSSNTSTRVRGSTPDQECEDTSVNREAGRDACDTNDAEKSQMSAAVQQRSQQ